MHRNLVGLHVRHSILWDQLALTLKRFCIGLSSK